MHRHPKELAAYVIRPVDLVSAEPDRGLEQDAEYDQASKRLRSITPEG